MRKTLAATPSRLDEAVENWRSLTEIRGIIAQEAFDYQDDLTQEVISRIRDRLREAATGWVSIKLPGQTVYSFRVEQDYVDFNLLYIATEIAKDLAFFDVKLANYKFPPLMCVRCGSEIEGTKKARKR